ATRYVSRQQPTPAEEGIEVGQRPASRARAHEGIVEHSPLQQQSPVLLQPSGHKGRGSGTQPIARQDSADVAKPVAGLGKADPQVLILAAKDRFVEATKA